jgi:hypothetical protein
MYAFIGLSRTAWRMIRGEDSEAAREAIL